jgi:hypothetical protein
VRELRTPGSVRGVLSNEHPYRHSVPLINASCNVPVGALHPIVACLMARRLRDRSRQFRPVGKRRGARP